MSSGLPSNALKAIQNRGYALAGNSNTAFLILGFQVGIGDEAFAKKATKKAVQAARTTGIGAFFTKVAFRYRYPEVAQTIKHLQPSPARRFESGPIAISPGPEGLSGRRRFDKKRLSAFSGNDLHAIFAIQANCPACRGRRGEQRCRSIHRLRRLG